MPYRVPNYRRGIMWAFFGGSNSQCQSRALQFRQESKRKKIEFTGKSKTDFALDLIYESPDYCVPDYIKSGLKWLSDQRVLE